MEKLSIRVDFEAEADTPEERRKVEMACRAAMDNAVNAIRERLEGRVTRQGFRIDRRYSARHFRRRTRRMSTTPEDEKPSLQ